MSHRIVRVLAAALAAAALAGCPNDRRAISGRVTGAISDGVAVTLTGGPPIATVTTSGGGLYEFTDLIPGDYTVTPSLPGYEFAPVQLVVTIGDSDVQADDFVARAAAATLDASP